MSIISIKRDWIPLALAGQMREASYALITDDFHKSNLTSLLGEGDPFVNAVHRLLRLFWVSPIPAVYSEVFGEDCALWLDFCTLRQHRAGNTSSHVAWHFDYNFFGNYQRALVAWVPFDPVGTDAPGLEFCLPVDELSADDFARVLENGRMPGSFSDAEVDRLFGTKERRLVIPQIGLGDIALFTSLILHRTQSMPEARADRLAIEFRMVSVSNPPPRQKNEQQGLYSMLSKDGMPLICRYKDLPGAA